MVDIDNNSNPNFFEFCSFSWSTPFTFGDDWLNFFGNFSGGIIGGVVAYIVAKQQINSERKKVKEQLEIDQIPTLVKAKHELKKL